ncbi:amidohydrolase family protein, partial [bacterium]|nr:amidohydrolase family protein [bacterium]
MTKLKIKNILLEGKRKDILIEGKKILKISKKIKEETEEEIEGDNLAALPIFFNMHTHLAMTLFRGIGDDLPLKKWLLRKIWPRELLLTKEKIRKGTEIGLKELKKSGCPFFCDMYWWPQETAKLVIKHKMGAILGVPFIGKGPLIFSKKFALKNFFELKKVVKNYPLIKIAIAPHAIYTVSKNNLVWAKDFAKKNNLYYHIHLAETKEEIKF